MDFINNLLPERLLQALGWTFIHSLWQGVLIALIIGCLFLVLRKYSARIRYALAVCSLAAIFILSISTFIRYYSDSPLDGNSEVIATGTNSVGELPGINDLGVSRNENISLINAENPGFLLELSGYFNRHFPLLVTLWLCGITFFLLKLMGGLIYSERIKFRGIKPLPETWNKRLSKLKSKLEVKRQVKIVESYLARVPMVIGYFKPVILIPLGALSGIPNDQLEAIIAHELAHIKRHDFLINIFQTLVESIFFYHPAIWWISGIIRKEREHCCDDLAVGVCDESLVYAKALANLEERSFEIPCFAVALTKRKHALLSRIKRLYQRPVTRNNPIEKWMTLGIMMMMITLLSFSFRTKGFHQAGAVVNPINAMTMGFIGTGINEIFSAAPTVELQDTLKKPETSTIRTTFFDASDQKEKEVKMIFEGKKVKELYIEGERVPDDQMDQYQELIDNTLLELEEAEQELKEAEKDLKEAEKTLAEIDFEQIHTDLESVMMEMKDLDMKEIKREMDLAEEQIREAIKQMNEIDVAEIRNHYQQAEQQLRESMQQYKDEDWTKFREEIEFARQEMAEAMRDIEMPDFEENFAEMKIQLEQFWNDFDTTEMNIEMQRNLEEIKETMKDFNQEYMHELKEEMREAKDVIRESMEELYRIIGNEHEQAREFHEQERQTRQLEQEEAREPREQERQTRQMDQEEDRQLREQERQTRQMDQEEVRRARELDREVQEHKRVEVSRDREVRTLDREKREMDRVIQVIEEQLVKDGFYTAGDPIDFELSKDKLIIDGKRQPKAVFELYKQIYVTEAGPLPEEVKVVIKK